MKKERSPWRQGSVEIVLKMTAVAVVQKNDVGCCVGHDYDVLKWTVGCYYGRRCCRGQGYLLV